jgi:hypothetical protein
MSSPINVPPLGLLATALTVLFCTKSTVNENIVRG